MKKIVILGGGQAQQDFINTAKSMGLYVICVGIDGDYPGYKLTDKVVNIDIYDKESILHLAQEEQIDAISMVCSDFGLETIGYINDQLHLCGITEQSAINAANKFLMKQKLEAANVNTSKFRIVRNDNDVRMALRDLCLPLIIKAVDLQGSRGIYKCNTPEEVFHNYTHSISESRLDYCLIEEFLEGEEFGVQAFIENGEIIFIEPHGDEVLRFGQANIPIGHYMPYIDHSDSKYAQIYDFVKKAILALGFDNCAVNVDLIMKDSIPYIIELTGRAGANYLPELTSAYLGFNYYEMIIHAALGESAKNYFDNKTNGSPAVMTRMLYSKESGIVDKIEEQECNNIKECTLFVREGERVNKFTNSRDCIGKVMAVGKTVSDCQDVIDNYINNKLKIKIIQ